MVDRVQLKGRKSEDVIQRIKGLKPKIGVLQGRIRPYAAHGPKDIRS
jgi:hypothetical protein